MTESVHMFNSKFHLESIGNDFDCLARVVKITETGNIGYTHPNMTQTFAYIDHSSLEALRDAIDAFLSFYTLPPERTFEWLKVKK